MAKVVRSVSVAEAKRTLSELLGRVAFGGETIVITRRGRPMARLIGPDQGARAGGLAVVRGWLDDDDPFLSAIESIVAARANHRPRALGRRRKGGR